MKNNKLKSPSIFTTLRGSCLSILALLLVVNCAKSKKNINPDDTYSIQELLNSDGTVVSGDYLHGQELKNPDLFLASDEHHRFQTSQIKGSKTLATLLSELPIRIKGKTSTLIGIDKKHLTVYALVSKAQLKNLSIIDQQIALSKKEISTRVSTQKEKINLSKVKASDFLVPLVHLPLKSLGSLDARKNDLGERTRKLEIKANLLASATHITLGSLGSRISTQFTNEKDIYEIFLTEKLNNVLVPNSVLTEKLKIDIALNKKEHVYLQHSGNKLKIYNVVEKDLLAATELRELLNKKSELVKACPASDQDLKSLKLNSCTLLLGYTVDAPIVHSRRMTAGNGESTGEIKADEALSAEEKKDTRLLRIVKNSLAIAADNAKQGLDPQRSIALKNIIGKEFLFRRTLQDSPNSFSASFAGLSGDLEIIKFKTTEKSLQVIRSEALLKTSGNSSVDNEILMELPVSYVVVKRTDSAGNTLVVPELNKVDPENPNAIALINWEDNKIPNTSSALSYYGLENCFSGARSKIISDIDQLLDSERGLLNFTQTSTYPSSTVVDCTGNRFASYFDRVQNNFTFKERFSFYEYVKPVSEEPRLDIPYSAQKKLGFGIFTYSKKKASVDGMTHLEENQVNLPATFDLETHKEITYVLAGLPKLAEIKDPLAKARAQEIRKRVIRGTEEVINDLNKAFIEAHKETGVTVSKTPFKLKLEEDLERGTLGDLDINFIYYVQKATDVGIIGLGGSHPNPRHGYVEAASVFLYGGNMIQASKSIQMQAQAVENHKALTTPIQLPNPPETESGSAPATSGSATPGSAASRAISTLKKTFSGNKAPATPINSQKQLETLVHKFANAEQLKQLRLGKLKKVESLNGLLRGQSLQFNRAYGKMKTLHAEQTQSKGGHFHESEIANIFNKELGNKVSYADFVMNNARKSHICLKQHNPSLSVLDNSASQAKMPVLDIFEGMWKSTLAHEIGHNLGLRHNFHGSYDKANWKFQDDSPESTRNYSSVMDYMVDDHITYDGLGPYDVSAIRAAYTGKIETQAGALISLEKIKENIGKDSWLDISKAEVKRSGNLKNFLYCSDEDASLEPTCKRFDSGSTPLEIVDNIIDNYTSIYGLANFPNKRLNFGPERIGRHIGRLFGNFMTIRQFLEETIYQVQIKGSSQEIVNSYAEAAFKGMSFFQQVIRNPDINPYSINNNTVVGSPTLAVDRFVETQVQSPDGPLLLRIEEKALQDRFFDESTERLQVIGSNWDKVVALMMLTDRNIGFPRYAQYSLNLSYADLMLGAPMEQRSNLTLLKEILRDSVAPMGTTPLGNLMLPPSFKVATSDLMKQYAILGAVAFLDVDALDSSYNNSALFRVFHQLETPEKGVPYITLLGSQNELKYYSAEENVIAYALIQEAQSLQLIVEDVEVKELMTKWLQTIFNQASTPDQVAEAELYLEEKIKDLNLSEENSSLESLAQILPQIINAAQSSVGNMTSRQGMIAVQRLRNQIEALSKDNPLLALALSSIDESVLPGLNSNIAQVIPSNVNEQKFATLLSNLSLSSRIFRSLHPEYFDR